MPQVKFVLEENNFTLALKENNATETGKVTSMFQMMNNIQNLINSAVENAKHEEKQLHLSKTELEGELVKEKDSLRKLSEQVQDERTNSDIYMRRFQKEKKLRKKIQEQLDDETKKMQKLEAALKAVSYEALVQIKDSFSKEEREIALSKDDRETVLRKSPSPKSPLLLCCVNNPVAKHIHSSISTDPQSPLSTHRSSSPNSPILSTTSTTSFSHLPISTFPYQNVPSTLPITSQRYLQAPTISSQAGIVSSLLTTNV
jgi:hypothetical protein